MGGVFTICGIVSLFNPADTVAGLAARRTFVDDGAGEGRRRQARQHGQGDARPDPAHPDQELEQAPLVGGREAVELERVLAHVQVSEQGDALRRRPEGRSTCAGSGQRRSRRRRRRRPRPRPRAARACPRGGRSSRCPRGARERGGRAPRVSARRSSAASSRPGRTRAKARDKSTISPLAERAVRGPAIEEAGADGRVGVHKLPAPGAARRAQHKATASASAASACGRASSASSRRTMNATCSLEAPPRPVTASLISRGAYSATATPRPATSHRTSPRTWPSTSVERTLRGRTPPRRRRSSGGAGRSPRSSRVAIAWMRWARSRRAAGDRAVGEGGDGAARPHATTPQPVRRLPGSRPSTRMSGPPRPRRPDFTAPASP